MPFNSEGFDSYLFGAAEHYQRLVHELVERREQLKISQRELAARLGWSVGDIRRFESFDDTTFSLCRILVYALAVSVTFDLGRVGDSPPLTCPKILSHRKPGPLREMDPEYAQRVRELVPDIGGALKKLRFGGEN